jgi:uncharacterized membrane protein YfcA
MAGVSGAFLVLPYQMSVLHFTSPAVSATNFLYNVVSIPSGVFRYVREGRMVWPLAWIVVAGTLPGVIVGGFIRIIYLPDPGAFKIFAACVLLYIGGRIFYGLREDAARCTHPNSRAGEESVGACGTVHLVRVDVRQLVFKFQDKVYRASPSAILLLSLTVGVIGGVYGIGGGAIIAPFFVAIFRLPVHAVAGASLMGTLITSVAGVIFYQSIAPFYDRAGLAVAPDWLLGTLFGLGGFVGMYIGARTQRYISARRLKLVLGLMVSFIAARYLAELL